MSKESASPATLKGQVFWCVSPAIHVAKELFAATLLEKPTVEVVADGPPVVASLSVS